MIWGLKCIEKLNGMWAMAILDKAKNELILIRDRAGVKPLYYYHQNNVFAFASELKGLLALPNISRRVNQNSLYQYLQTGYVKTDTSIIEGIVQLPAAHYGVLNINTLEFKTQKYWTLESHYLSPKLNIGEADAVNFFLEKAKKAFLYRTIGDVPFGVMLSGGYDSSMVSAVLQQASGKAIHSFNIGFENSNFDESKYAADVAKYLGTEHHTEICTANEAKNIFEKYAKVYDEPMGDSAGIPAIQVSALAAKHVTVILSADGADEMMHGYNRYNEAEKIYGYVNKLPNVNLDFIKHLIPKRYERFLEAFKNSSPENINYIINSFNSNNDIANLMADNTLAPKLKTESNKLSIEERILLNDFEQYMPSDLLHKIDRSTMYHSIESREPFLDVELLEMMATLPHHLKVKNSINKYLLKEATHKILPKELLDRPKMGFSVPLDDWLRGSLKPYVDYYLSETVVKKQGLLNSEVVMKLYKQYYLENKRYLKTQIWLILVLGQWAEEYLVEN